MNNVCKVFSVQDFLILISKACFESSKPGSGGASYFYQQLKDMITLAKQTAEPEQQVKLLKEALDSFYESQSAIGKYVLNILQANAKEALFNDRFKTDLATTNPATSLEERGKASNRIRLKNLLDTYFKGAPNAKLYFLRSTKIDLVETFLVRRSGENPTFYETSEAVYNSVIDYKQSLLDKIIEFLNYIDPSSSNLKGTKLYLDGVYTRVLENKEIKALFDHYLSYKNFLDLRRRPLDSFYASIRDGLTLNESYQSDKLFLDAYNAWTLLLNFDAIVEDTIGSIVKVKADKHSHDISPNKYEVKIVATNIWKNWTSSDDITDMADVISDVTQYLIETSKMYKWNNGEAYVDRYVSFADFNYILGKIKKLINNPKSNLIDLKQLLWEPGRNASLDTKLAILEIALANKNRGLDETAPVTFKQLLARLGEKPQQFIHTIFDLLCNTNILQNFEGDFKFNDFEKNLLWSFDKEIFSHNSTRSVFRLFKNSDNDTIYHILSQLVVSTFPEEYLQYYERIDGTIGTRLLRDYALDRVLDVLLHSIQQKAIALNPAIQNKYIKDIESRDDDKFLASLTLQVGKNLKIIAYADSVLVDLNTNNVASLRDIWGDVEVLTFFKEVLGFDFLANPDLQNAYLELFNGVKAAIDEMSIIAGRAFFNSLVNRIYVPKHKVTNRSKLKQFILNQYLDKAVQYDNAVSRVPILSDNFATSYLSNLAMALAMNDSLLSASQSKTGEGTAIANYVLSRNRNAYPNQIEMQCKNPSSASNDLEFVTGLNGLYIGAVSRREIKTLKTNLQTTKFSDLQSIKLGFISDFLAGLLPTTGLVKNLFIKDGKTAFTPTVNSDKPQIDGLLTLLSAKNSQGKTYRELNDVELEQEMIHEFGPVYNKIINNIHDSLSQIVSLLGFLVDEPGGILANHRLLDIINDTFMNDESLGDPKDRVVNGLHKLITEYNKNHFRNPIQLAEDVHYVVNKNGKIGPNKVLESLWGRFNQADAETSSYLRSLYSNENSYYNFIQRNGLTNDLSLETYFLYKDYLTAKHLIETGFKLPLYGPESKVRPNLKEINFLRGTFKFEREHTANPDYRSLLEMHSIMPNWISDDYKMIIAKGQINGSWVNITTVAQLKHATNIHLHPAFKRFNRLDYLMTQPYVLTTVGSHYVHGAKPKDGKVLTEESNRWSSSNKRNNAATATVQVYLREVLNGAPSIINLAVMDDPKYDLYSVMGDIYRQGHAPLDGCMFSSAFMPDLLNNSLGGERVGSIQKPYGTFYDEKTCAGGSIKTASFPATNDLMRNHLAWRNMQKAMSSFKWTKEQSGPNGENIYETELDITKDYFNRDIDYTQVIKGPIMYKRPAHDNPEVLAAYRLDYIEKVGTNQYIIYETEIDGKGNPILKFDENGNEVTSVPRSMPVQENQYDDFGNLLEISVKQVPQILTIDNNWDLFTQVFGGYNSVELGPDGFLTYSENSVKLMVHAMNNIGYRKNFDHITDSELRNELETKEKGLYQSDIWQPLKYSEVHFIPNKGAIKSLTYNINKDYQSIFDGKANLNFFSIRLSQFGVLLDKEHHADNSEVSMPTLIVQATANKGYTYEYTKEINTALATLTRVATEPLLEGLKDIIKAGPDLQNSQAKLVEEVTNIILEKLSDKKNDDSPASAILKAIQEKADKGLRITYVDDIKGKIAWSDPTIMNKLFSTLSTSLTDTAIKVKLAGSLSIICPTDPIIKLHGDRTRSTFEPVVNLDGSARTMNAETLLLHYLESVRNGNEVDSNGRNMLIYDFNRDLNGIDTVSEYEDPEVLETIHTITIGTLKDERSFNKLLSINDEELNNVTKDACIRYNIDFSENVILYVKHIINYIKNANITFNDISGSFALNIAKHELLLDNRTIRLLDKIRELLKQSATELPTEVLHYGKFKKYEKLINESTLVLDDVEYDASKKGYPITPSGLLAVDTLIHLFGNNNYDSDVLNLLFTILNTLGSIIPTSKTKLVNYILQGISKTSYGISKETRLKLSKLSEIKTQHNYIIEFDDGSVERITVNTPQEYEQVKHMVLSGKNRDVSNLVTPVTYEELLYNAYASLPSDLLSEDPYNIVKNSLSLGVLDYKSVRKETGLGHTEMRNLLGLYKSKAKGGGMGMWTMARRIWGENLHIFASDLDVMNIMIDILTSAKSMKDIYRAESKALFNTARDMAYGELNLYKLSILDTYHMSSEQYLDYYYSKSKVVKVYEDVEKGRGLSAYNVRFSNKINVPGLESLRFLIYDLDSIKLLYDLNHLILSDELPKGYENFMKLSEERLQEILNKIFSSTITLEIRIKNILASQFENLPEFSDNFITEFNTIYPGQLAEFIDFLYNLLHPRVFKHMQKDLFKLSEHYKGKDRYVYVNGDIVEPMDMEYDAYELIMPKIYKTQFGLNLYDDLQEILRDKEFFIKRGLSRFKCKFSNHNLYDYELKNFNGEHIYVLDKSKGIPEELSNALVVTIEPTKRKGNVYRVDNDNVMYQMSSELDFVCKIDGVEVIVTDNPLFYVLNLNYNTLKTSPTRVTEDSYLKLITTLSESKRKNSKNFLKAISVSEGVYFDLATFKEFNTKIDEINYNNVKFDPSAKPDFKSVALLCRLLLLNGRELWTSFDESLNLVAGRIPAQSLQSFMPQRVIAFDNVDRNTAMVSTFLLFLLGSDLDIDAVTLFGYEFNKNGKFIGWSPYFDLTTRDNLQASKYIPLPTGIVSEVVASEEKATSNFFEVYDKYFGTLFKTIQIGTTAKDIRTKDGVPELQLVANTPENLRLLANFLRDFNKYGIQLKTDLKPNGKLRANSEFFERKPITLENGTTIQSKWNLFRDSLEGGLNVGHDLVYLIAQLLILFANDHNNYINIVDDYLQDGMAKNYLVNYIYKVSISPSNQTECLESVDNSTKIGKQEAGKYESNDFAPGGAEVKYMSIGEGQAGKDGVGIGATAIKANSTTQYYLAKLLEEGSDEDLRHVLFRKPYVINGKTYKGFANMYTDKDSEDARNNFIKILELLNSLEKEDLVTRNVSTALGSLLSLAVDNAKDLALKKINSGPKSFGLYAYGISLGIHLEELAQIINSPQGKLLVKLTEGDLFNNDRSSFRIIDVFSKLEGNLGSEINLYKQSARNSLGYTINYESPYLLVPKNKSLKLAKIGNTVEALYAALFESYADVARSEKENPKLAESLSSMVGELFRNGRLLEVFNGIDNNILEEYFNKVAYEAGPEIAKHIKASVVLLKNYILDMFNKSQFFFLGDGVHNYAKDLRILAEGAEEMRILGAILSINKGLKATVSETETFMEMIENLIVDRKLILGLAIDETDIIDFEKFMTNRTYQNEVIKKYASIKHSINIPHLITTVEHFNGYLRTGIIPISFFNIASVKYRTLSKYRKNVNAGAQGNPIGLFDALNLTTKRDKDQAIRGLENLIQFKLLTRWAYNKRLSFTVPKGFEYFTRKTKISTDDSYSPTVSNPNEEVTIPLYTEAGLASFKKYMEEYYIPALQNDASLKGNTFVRNLTPIGYDKTPLHNEVTVCTLNGDLSAKKGRQAEINEKMFADFRSLASYQINGLSVHDAFYLYALYCYMGRKGQTSLMALFDSEESSSTYVNSFRNHIASMDVDGNISCSYEELIAWCAPVANQSSNALFAYVMGRDDLAKSLKTMNPDRTHYSNSDPDEELNYDPTEALDAVGEHYSPKAENYIVYNEDYLSSLYDLVIRDHFLVPSTTLRISKAVNVPIKTDTLEGTCQVLITSDKVFNIVLSEPLEASLNALLLANPEPKYQDAQELVLSLIKDLDTVQIPYKASLYKSKPQEIDLGILQTIIEQKLNC